MKKWLILVIPLVWILSFNCAGEKKIVQPTYMPQEKCDAPVWNVGDYWKFQHEDDKSWWSHKVIRVENDLYIVENPKDRCTYIYDTKTLQLKIGTDYEAKKTISSSESGIFYDFPLYVGKKWAKKFRGKQVWGMPTNIVYLCEFSVGSLEDITVPAGTFKAFNIEFTRKIGTLSVLGYPESILSYPNYLRYYIWYSPEVKNIIKYSYVGQEGG